MLMEGSYLLGVVRELYWSYASGVKLVNARLGTCPRLLCARGPAVLAEVGFMEELEFGFSHMSTDSTQMT